MSFQGLEGSSDFAGMSLLSGKSFLPDDGSEWGGLLCQWPEHKLPLEDATMRHL